MMSINKKQDWMRCLIKKCFVMVIPLLLLYFLLTKIIFVSIVMSESMAPTLEVNQSAVYNRLSYVFDNPNYGDIVVFYSDEFDEYFAKRIIGVPGDTIEFIDGSVYVNGSYLDESAYLQPELETNCANIFEVPAGYYYMLGDNRENSNDSRFWEYPYISQNDIKGKYILCVPFSINSLYDSIRRIQYRETHNINYFKNTKE